MITFHSTWFEPSLFVPDIVPGLCSNSVWLILGMLWDISEDLIVVRNFWVDNTSLLKEGDMISGRNSLKYVVLVNLQLDFWAILILRLPS